MAAAIVQPAAKNQPVTLETGVAIYLLRPYSAGWRAAGVDLPLLANPPRMAMVG